ncbi:MAG TPA: phage baseplate assembly protein V [Trebonia sp.]|nr:phage baseplate assembly protein V [Trebonia sp.]
MNAPDSHPAEYAPDQARLLFYGKYRGTVSAVDAATCRIKARVPSVLGDADTGWCMPCVPYAGPQVGIAFLPEEGSGVWIEFEGGDVSYPVWVGCYWRDGEPPPDAAAHVKVIVTTAPHKLVLNDDDGSITITDPNGNAVTLNASGITLSKGGQQVLISDASVSVNDGALEVQ